MGNLSGLRSPPAPSALTDPQIEALQQMASYESLDPRGYIQRGGRTESGGRMPLSAIGSDARADLIRKLSAQPKGVNLPQGSDFLSRAVRGAAASTGIGSGIGSGSFPGLATQIARQAMSSLGSSPLRRSSAPAPQAPAPQAPAPQVPAPLLAASQAIKNAIPTMARAPTQISTPTRPTSSVSRASLSPDAVTQRIQALMRNFRR